MYFEGIEFFNTFKQFIFYPNDTVFFSFVIKVFIILEEIENLFSFTPDVIHGQGAFVGQDVQYVILEPQQCFKKRGVFFGIGSVNRTKEIGQLNHFIPKTVEFTDGFLSFLIGTGYGENKWKNNCNTQNGKINLKIEIEFVIEKINDQSFDNNKDHPKIDR